MNEMNHVGRETKELGEEAKRPRSCVAYLIEQNTRSPSLVFVLIK